MADLELIHFTPMRSVVEDGSIRWERDKLNRPISKLPQIFWANGAPWREANHWALTRVYSTAGGHIKTVTSLMKHLAAYASWLDDMGLDWRHFPARLQDRTVVLFRAELIAQRNRGSLAPSTAKARMAAVLQFYRHAKAYGLVNRTSPLWNDKQVVIRYFDTVGFERSLLQVSSELAIRNRARPGLVLEDGLTPLRLEHANSLLEFTREQQLEELNLMLSIGLLTGARIGSITTLSVKNIEGAIDDDSMRGAYRIRVGPGTGVDTKGNVSGYLVVPHDLLNRLKTYAYSMQRLRRQDKASATNRGLLFLTVRGNPYTAQSFNSLMTDLRRRAVSAGMRFMQSFKFHQTRATFGTTLMGLAMQVTDLKTAVAFVRDALLHKDDKTTMLYVRFIQEAPVRALISDEFSRAFSGLVDRDWNQLNA
ncbi:MAG: site-specific integrase [Burkholderiaceae bacterium]|jgi:integrase|nr:MAG: site-specific integrase [Burkholderiaceae bacterium]